MKTAETMAVKTTAAGLSILCIDCSLSTGLENWKNKEFTRVHTDREKPGKPGNWSEFMKNLETPEKLFFSKELMEKSWKFFAILPKREFRLSVVLPGLCKYG